MPFALTGWPFLTQLMTSRLWLLLANVVAANPGEVVPVAHLVFHFGELAAVLGFQFGARMHPRRLAVPVGAQRDDVADRAVVQALDGFDVAGLMMALEPDPDLEAFLFRLLGGGEHFADTGRIGGDGFFREDVFARFDRGLDLHRAEAGRRGEDDDIGDFDGFFKSIEAEELALFRHVDAVGVLGFEIVERAGEAVFVDIGHSHEFDRADLVRAECLIRRAAAATAAADEGDFDFVIARGVGETLGGERAEERAAGHGRGAFFQKGAPVKGVRCDDVGGFLHSGGVELWR